MNSSFHLEEAVDALVMPCTNDMWSMIRLRTKEGICNGKLSPSLPHTLQWWISHAHMQRCILKLSKCAFPQTWKLSLCYKLLEVDHGYHGRAAASIFDPLYPRIRGICRPGEGGRVSVCTSESPRQNLLGEIRGVKHLGHWIRRSDVGQIAPQTGPNPRYRRIGPKSDLSNVRGKHGRLHISLRFVCVPCC